MREIKFRVYETEKYGSINVIEWEELVNIFKNFDELIDKTFFGEDESWKLVQYTGLKDENGIEIYEGDVINITQYFGGMAFGSMKHFVDRSKYNNELIANRRDDDTRVPEYHLHFDGSNDYEVIGNIYENPELLEVD